MVSTKVYKSKSGHSSVIGKRWSCSLSPDLANQLNVGENDHIRINRDSGCPCYVRIRKIHKNEKYPLRVPKKTRKKAGLEHHERVTLSKVIPQEDYIEARKNNSLAETVWDDGEQNKILIYAPHGGDIEFGTDDAAIRLYKKLDKNGYNVSLWCLHGFGPNSFNRWHASKPGLTSGNYPGLGKVRDRAYDLVISFHVQNKSYTGIGGGVKEGFREKISDKLDERIKDRYEFRHNHENMRWEGVSDSNLVNKLCNDEGGLQVEMQPIIGYKYRKKAVDSIYSVIQNQM
ncbi:poly-gamma-glutamate hydrolase family protein [Halostella salina]|uniref:poly-gamma-glutamate hydrolase family protein n=1 Tax=Halostella salina TaxID=1547897 RepID=UPI000EF83A32|nr:poly-gamma-glutamate hydrolase family protein [Halostella salina]